MRLALLTTVPAFAARQLTANLFAVSYGSVLVTNVGHIPQRIKVTFDGEGYFGGLIPHPQILGSSLTCPIPSRCVHPYVTLAPGKTLWTGIGVTTQPPAAHSGLKLAIDVSEDRGAITAHGVSQFIYFTGSDNSQINLPFPVVINGGRPF